MTEDWYHGNIERREAERRLIEHSSMGDGLFLVRDSGTFIGDVSLSCLYVTLSHFTFTGALHIDRVNGKPSHMRVKTKPVDGVRWYYITDTCKRDTLYELIAYHQKHPVCICFVVLQLMFAD
jgi:hypothetical protein